MENLRGLSSFYITRGLERLLPVSTLHSVMKSAVRIRATKHGLTTSAPQISPPSFFKENKPVRSLAMSNLNFHLNSQLEIFPDRLARSKWKSRCRVVGLERIQQACENKIPVVLGFCHLGPFQLMGYWIRAFGIPAATVVKGLDTRRSQINRLKARFSPFPNLPTVFPQDKLQDAIKFLESGKPLLVALDAFNGRQLKFSFRDGWTYQIATGALRLAARHNADLIFCSIIEEGPWRFCLEFGKPVPKEFLADEDDLVPAAKHLLSEMLIQFEKYPEQCRELGFKRFQKISASAPEQSLNETSDSHQLAAR